MSYEVVDFQKDVIDQSKELPVVVDFWAPWCGPCRVLGPVIEHLADNAAGKWKLIKVNSDNHQNEAARYQVRGIPAVKMFYKGEVVAEFTGALPEHEIKKWLEKNLPAPKEELEVLSRIEQLKMAGKHNEARELASKAVEKYPDNGEIRHTLFRMLLPKFIERAQNVFSPLSDDPRYFEDREVLETFLQLKERWKSDEYLDGHEKVVSNYREAIQYLFNESFEEALQRFIEVISIDRTYDQELARKACIAIFRLLGEDHPLTKTKRRAFSMALY